MVITISIILLIVVLVEQVYDAWSTIKILREGGQELNLVVAWIISKIGLVPAIIITKAGISSVFIWVVWNYGCDWKVSAGLAVIAAAYVRIF